MIDVVASSRVPISSEVETNNVVYSVSGTEGNEVKETPLNDGELEVCKSLMFTSEPLSSIVP